MASVAYVLSQGIDQNPVSDVVTAFLLFVLFLCCARLLLTVVLRWIEQLISRTTMQVPLIVIRYVRQVSWWVWGILCFVLAMQILTLPAPLSAVIHGIAIIVTTFIVVQLTTRVLVRIVYRHAPRFRSTEG